MKNSTKICLLLAFVIVIVGSYQHGKLEAFSAKTPPKIGVVNVTKVLENSQRHKQWQEKMKAEQAETRKQFDQMKQELEAVQANLKLRTPGTEDFLALRQEMVEKTALLEARDESYSNRVEVQMKNWTESLYQDLIKVVEEIAKEKGLDMIISDEDLELPAPSLRDFMLTMKTKKMIYHNEKFDLTDEAQAALDNTK